MGLTAIMVKLGFNGWWFWVPYGIKNTPICFFALGEFLTRSDPSEDMCIHKGHLKLEVGGPGGQPKEDKVKTAAWKR